MDEVKVISRISIYKMVGWVLRVVWRDFFIGILLAGFLRYWEESWSFFLNVRLYIWGLFVGLVFERLFWRLGFFRDVSLGFRLVFFLVRRLYD